MRVRVIKKITLVDFAARQIRSRVSLEIWLTILKMADWNQPSDIIKTFGTADLLGKGSNRVVFDIAGNNYRMICKYYFGRTMVHLYIKWIGTHDAYSKLCQKNDQYIVDQF